MERVMDVDPNIYLTHSPHNSALNLKLPKIGKGSVTMEMPYQEKLVGDPETGVIAGGAVTSLLDTACGLAVFTNLSEMRAISTIDIRIEYLRTATPHKSILATAECYRITRHVAFVRATAYHEGGPESEHIAHANAIFSISALKIAEIAPELTGGAL